MSRDFLDEMLDALQRIGPLDLQRIKEMLVLCALPEETEDLRYLADNRQVFSLAEANVTFSAVAVINNRRIGKWRRRGIRKALDWIFFRPLWSQCTPSEFFLSRLRGDSRMLHLMAASRSDYTLLGTLRIVPLNSATGRPEIRPVIALAGLNAAELEKVRGFETRHRLYR